ncbi:hypothetical protein I41_13390 [Lacipirellula limnantheis]|uniref:Uncharacterized protein n=1 Tax=Lacipirellula limnantheis TaxID=2528024 RepID=A0A517TUX6_9BACT|nr:hypothetical protein I41_13390 [Lacipirellula limnantheis]
MAGIPYSKTKSALAKGNLNAALTAEIPLR